MRRLLFSFLLAACGGSQPNPETASNTAAPPGVNPSVENHAASTAMSATAQETTPPPVDETPKNDPSLPLLFVGSGDWGTLTGALTSYRFAPSTGALTRIQRVDVGGLLSFLAADSAHKFVYAADEGERQLRSFSLKEDGTFALVESRETQTGPVYVRLTSDNSHILAAQFNGARTQVFALDGQGHFGAETASVDSGAETHSVYLSKDERFAFTPGRGSDKITQFRFDTKTGKLTPAGATAEVKGVGCRHMAFASSNKNAYLVNEFENAISVFTFAAATGKLKKVQSLSTLPAAPPSPVKSSAADVHLHPNGKFLYVTNRPAEGNGSIAAFQIAADGKLSLLEHISTEGRVPRNFTLNSTGNLLVVGNQESKTVASFNVNPETGKLTLVAVTPVDVKPFFVGFLAE